MPNGQIDANVLTNMLNQVLPRDCGDELRSSDPERLVAAVIENHRSPQVLRLREPVLTDRLELRFVATPSGAPVALFAMRCYADA